METRSKLFAIRSRTKDLIDEKKHWLKDIADLRHMNVEELEND